MKRRAVLSVLITASLLSQISAQCPWQRELVDLQSSCLCSYNLGHELSVQCDIVNWPKLLEALHKYATGTPLDLLYVNNSTIGVLQDSIFADLRVHNIQLSGCKIKTVSDAAFDGQEQFLKNLNLQDNDLVEVPIQSLRPLRNLHLLDLSHNRITEIPDGAFSTLSKLTTLKMTDNNVTLKTDALRGLEGSLKNLNLKGTRQKDVPEAVRGMETLAFLDLSQNSIRELPGQGGLKSFEGLDSLTALNLERNLIQKLGENAFFGIRSTLSSLSMLNNLLPDFPTAALETLSELRVLDIGFNLLTELPEDAFVGNPSITLLALDGNPLTTIPFAALSHLNNTLRGLSLGGRFLHCDCRLSWVIDWIRNGDLQVTSRERNPQFCGSPPRFRDRGFYSIQPEELTCNGDGVGVATPLNEEQLDATFQKQDEVKPSPQITSTSTTKESSTSQSTTTSSTTALTTTPTTTTTTTTTKATQSTNATQSTTKSHNPVTRSTVPPWRSQANQRPSIVMGYPSRNKGEQDNEVIVKDAYRQDNSVIIKWSSETANILGFRVVYRLFGDKSFKQGPPLEASEREFKIKNVPPHECIIVCVVSLEDTNVTPETVKYTQCREVRTAISAHKSKKVTIVSYLIVSAILGVILRTFEGLLSSLDTMSAFNYNKECIIVCVVSLEDTNVTPETVEYTQCREVRTVTSASSNMDKITIAASAAICGTIVVAVIIFIAASRRRSKKLRELHRQKIGLKPGLPITGLPINCCSTASPGGPLSSLATMSAFNNNKDWDQISSYSTHSTQRPRMYAVEQPSSLQDDLRSHFSSKGNKTRSIADGQSQHSFSNHSGRYMASNPFPGNLLASRQDLRQSRQSLAMQSDRMTRSSHLGPHHAPPHSVTSSTRRSRPRSRSRDHNRPGSRYSTGGSTHTLNNYCDNSDNWTDHDMEIYMARNPTTRNGLVPL